MRVIRWAEIAEQPWKNGGGTTREIWREPAGDGGFDWRVSVADVSSPGPFSLFPGHDRIIMPLSGHGMELRQGGELYANLEALVPFAFPGEAELAAVLPHGPVTDFNLIVKRRPGRVGAIALLRCDRGSPVALPAQTLLAFVAAGSFTIAGFGLAARDSVLCDAETPGAEGSGVLACCCLMPL